MNRKIVVAVFVSALLFSAMLEMLLATPVRAQGEATVRILESPIKIDIGKLFNITVIIENVPEDPGAVGIDFNLTWNPSILEGVSMMLPPGHFLTPDGDDGNVWKLKHEVEPEYGWYAYTFLDIQRGIDLGYLPKSGDGTLAIITLNSTAPGTTDLHFDVIKVGGVYWDPRGYWASQPIPTTPVDGTVMVLTLLGDLNYDRKVDLYDIIQASLAFGSYLGHPRWDPMVDIDNDSIVDIYDIILIAKNFGKTT